MSGAEAQLSDRAARSGPAACRRAAFGDRPGCPAPSSGRGAWDLLLLRLEAGQGHGEGASHEGVLLRVGEGFEAVLNSISDGVFAVDAAWRITCFNAAAERNLGVRRDQVLGHVPEALLVRARDDLAHLPAGRARTALFALADHVATRHH